MDKPELYENYKFNITLTEKYFEKYWHYIKWVETPESIVDVGVGDGKVANYVIIPRLPPNIKEYIGSDASQNMLDFSKKVIDFPKYDTLQMDICADKVPNEYENRFDKVFTCIVLHILGPNLKQGIENIFKLLKPGGQLICLALARRPIDGAYQKLEKTKWKKYQHFKFLSAFCNSENPSEDYRKLMKQVGFEENFTISQDETIRYADLQTARNVWESVNLILKNIPAEEYHEYIEDYFKAVETGDAFSRDETTGEVLLKSEVIFAVLTKPNSS